MTLLLLLLSCGSEEFECSEKVACGFGEVCVEGKCQGRACATSAQCGMEERCDDGACVSGCDVDEDCYPGDTCQTETSTCEAAACTDTRIDCAFEQFCNSATGECYDAGGYYCHPCLDDGDCGGSGNLCLSLGNAESYYCGVTCTSESDCPSGYTCAGVADLSGNIVAYQCITYCWLYDEDARVSAPPSTTQPVWPGAGR